MPAASRLPFTAGLLALALGATSAVAADLGVPRDGFDRVLLDDGRVVDARALPREGELVPLEFRGGTIRVPRSRVREVRRWQDFDPAPRDADEKAKAAQGFVRWNGVLVPPARAEKMREEEAERDRRSRAGAEIPWEAMGRPTLEAGKFSLYSNASREEVAHWGAALGALSKQMVEAFPGSSKWSGVYVFLFRDEASAAVQRTKDAGRSRDPGGYTSPWDPGRRVDVVLGDRTREENLPLVLRPAAIRLFEEMMSWKADDMGGWVRVGVPCYFGSATFEKGVLRVGEVDDGWLYLFRDMAEKGTLPSLEEILQAGNEYWKGEFGEFGNRSAIEANHVPCAWMLVHFLLKGEDGKYRGGLVNWVRFWSTTKIGSKRTDNTGSFKDEKALLLQFLKLKDLDPIKAGILAHAKSLDYRGPEPDLILAQRLWKDRQDAAGALGHIERAFTRSAGSARDLRRVGVACAAVAGGEKRAQEILAAAVEADPLDGTTRLEWAKVLPPDEAAKQKSLGESLGGKAHAGADPAPPGLK